MAMNSFNSIAISFMAGRNAPPSHYLITIESSLLQASLQMFTSDEFDAGGYKWRLCIYPTGNKDKIEVSLFTWNCWKLVLSLISGKST
ncbi:hypothetical protein LWI29_013730 [Acer saccharum]|uniref:MATH domain-containing protein n=1 Tax=Acer saccharum TaxID=4024 RepID=A0AA39VZF9_ACESA|nr:hypothetical protein LWI29_013730 [Acer saccharum]